MGKKDIYDFLQKNPRAFFSTDELSKILKINFQSTRSALNKLNSEKQLSTKQVRVSKVGPTVCYYSMKDSDDLMDQTMFEYTKLRTSPDFATSNQQLVIGLMQLNELKKIREVLENGSKTKI